MGTVVVVPSLRVKVPSRVALSSNGENNEIIITVSDTGCGIRPEHFQKIFDPYFTTKSSGTGLGLAIAHNIVEAMDGRINVESDREAGTTFTVTLPNSEESKDHE